MKQLTYHQKERIEMFIKNGIDVSDLIKDYDIRGLNLANAIIKDFNRIKADMSRTNFMNAKLGEEGKLTVWSRCICKETNFVGTQFLGIYHIRHCDCRGSNFQNANMANCEYQYSDFRNANFCTTIIRLSSDYFYKAIVDENLFRDLTKFLNLEVKVKPHITNNEIEKRIQ